MAPSHPVPDVRQAIAAALQDLHETLGSEVFPTMVSTLQEEADRKLELLYDRAGAGDLGCACRMAHTLAGLLAQFGALDASAAASRASLAVSVLSLRTEVDGLLIKCRIALQEITAQGQALCEPV